MSDRRAVPGNVPADQSSEAILTQPAAGRGRFALAVALLLVAYAGVESLYIAHMPLVMDEFQGAYAVHELARGVPYRDFIPYKTVLGYALQLPVLELVPGLWASMLAVKVEMMLFVVAAFAAACFVLRRSVSGGATVAALAMTLAMSDFLERSAELRVDMLTAIFGLLSLLLLLRRQEALAGSLAAASFLVSQKGAVFVLAGVCFLLLTAGPFAAAVRGASRYLLTAAALLVLYLAGWSCVAPPAEVVRSVLFGPAAVVTTDAVPIRAHFWMQTLTRNPIFYALSLLAMVTLVRRDRALAAYAAVVALFAVAYPQPWPYHFVLLVPTMFVVLAAGGGGWFSRPRLRLLVVGIFVAGVAWPLARLPIALRRDNGAQRAAVELAHALVGRDESYLAGVDLLYDRRQAPQALRFLDNNLQIRLHHLPAGQLAATALSLAAAPNTVVVVNEQLSALPAPLLRVIRGRYAPLWGNVWIYAPAVLRGRFVIEHTGTYALQPLGAAGAMQIDGAAVAGRVALARGAHTYAGAAPLRLKLQPAGWEGAADRRFGRPQPLFPAVYSY
jgi:hypothetical protein